uniref:Cyclic nucleotide-binding domain-containing protein n=1 Tax=Heliothis virescens TaxID=7102 RepID=A0A2A4JQH3_HELVI
MSYYGERESYYEHNCRVQPEKDVLDVDIAGGSPLASLRRWWHDLFLLSYSCRRSRGFYSSTFSMKQDRFKQFRKYRHRIHPMSKFRDFWDLVILHVFIINKVLLKFTASVFYDNLSTYFYYIGACLEVIIFADLYVNMKTGFIDKETRRVVLDTRSSLVNFCSQKVFLHVAAAIPIHWLLFLRYGHNVACGLCKTNRFTCILRIIGVFAVFRIFETSTYWCRSHNSLLKKYLFRLIRIFVLASISMIQLSELSEILSILTFILTGVVSVSITSVILVMKYAKATSNFKLSTEEIDLFTKLTVFLPLIKSVRNLTLFWDTILSLCATFITWIFYGWSVIECFGLVNALTYSNDQKIKLKKKAMNFVASNQFSTSVNNKITDYFKYKSAVVKVTETRNALYKGLPEILKNEIKESCYLNIMMRLPVFTQWPVPVLQELAVMLQRKVYLKNDMVSLAMAQGEGLMIVYDGMLAVYSRTFKELGHLIDGDYFGAMSLVTDREVCSSSVIAVTDSTILVLNKRVFRMYMRTHQQLFERFKTEISKERNEAGAAVGSLPLP